MSTLLRPTKDIVYPESDGQPMAENTLQFEWIVTIKGGIDADFRDDPQVFVAGDLFWYPVEGDPSICMAPDVLVAFGRRKGHRGSYQQWVEGGIAPQVIWEVLSPGNRPAEMDRKFQFYELFGVEEYYVYDPANAELSGWIREGDRLKGIPRNQLNGWISPRLGIRFDLNGGELQIYGRDGRPFATYVELVKQRERERQEKERERQEKERERQAKEKERQAKELAYQEIERLKAQLRAVGQEPQE